jgi:hypothetical protein
MAKAEDKTAPAPAAAAKIATPAAAAAAPAAAARNVTPLIVARWSEAQFTQARHAIRPEANTPYADLLDPGYYAHIAGKVNVNDILEVRPAEGSYYAEMYVWAKGPSWLQVSELVRIARPANAVLASVNQAFAIDFVDGPAKHRVIRKSDRQVMGQGFDSPEAANAWLAQNSGRLAA